MLERLEPQESKEMLELQDQLESKVTQAQRELQA
jgi:hypothetical protein